MTTQRRGSSSSRGGSATGFYVLCLLFSPAIVLGYLTWVAKLLVARGSASGTAQGPLSARWMQHRLGLRDDDAASRLLMALPSVSSAAVWLVFGPMLVAHRMTGFVPSAFRYPFEGDMTVRNQAAARQSFYDRAVGEHLSAAGQFVVLGAGFDTRALRVPHGQRSFEVDTPQTIGTKLAALDKARVDHSQVTYVAADFNTEDWFVKLCAAGFDREQPSLFIWEGVTPYLRREAIEASLARIGRCAPGTILAFDFLTTYALESKSLGMRLVRVSLRAGGEPLIFGLDTSPSLEDRLSALLAVHHLKPSELVLVAPKRPLGGFVIAEVV